MRKAWVVTEAVLVLGMLLVTAPLWLPILAFQAWRGGAWANFTRQRDCEYLRRLNG